MKSVVEIAGIKMNVDVPFVYEKTEAFQPFHNQTGDADKEINVNFIPVKEAIVYEKENLSKERYVLVEKDNKKYLGYHIYQNGCHAWMEECEDTINCYYMEESQKYFPTERQLYYVVCLEQLLNKNHGFILHSSFISWKDNGILFTANSGVGKSTQAELWKTYESADIINGDRSGIRKVNNEWRAYGLPYAGSSDIYRNEFYPVKAIVVLEQAKENKIEKISAGKAFRYLYPQITMHPYDQEFMQRLILDLEDLIANIPIYKLYCLPDKGAVEVLKQEIEVIINE